MSKGIDADVPLTNHAACLRGAGVEWCARYIKAHNALTHAEALALSEVGLQIVTIYEWGAPTSRAYFSHAKGLADGKRGYEYARDVLKQPHGSAIYYTVDYDAAIADIHGPVAEYFQGIHAAFESLGSLFSVGVYGSGATCAHIRAHTPTAYAWLAMSKGWLQSRVYRGWNIEQLAGETICGVEADTNRTQGAHFGAWQLP